jgi:glutaminyl-peptide cyclotransferase
MYKGDLLANVFMQNTILRIDPESGAVKEKYDFSDLVTDVDNSEGYKNYTKRDSNFCLNGIAYDSETDRLLLTGKMWPFIY